MYNCKGPPRHEEGQRVNSTASFLLSAGMLGDGEVYRYLFFSRAERELHVACWTLPILSLHAFSFTCNSPALSRSGHAPYSFCFARMHTDALFLSRTRHLFVFSIFISICDFYIYQSEHSAAITICVYCIFYAVCGDREPRDAGETPDPLSLPGGACGGPVRLRRAYVQLRHQPHCLGAAHAAPRVARQRRWCGDAAARRRRSTSGACACAASAAARRLDGVARARALHGGRRPTAACGHLAPTALCKRTPAHTRAGAQARTTAHPARPDTHDATPPPMPCRRRPSPWRTPRTTSIHNLPADNRHRTGIDERAVGSRAATARWRSDTL
jgi:hypothetical protein